jgi:hypothetical protein
VRRDIALIKLFIRGCNDSAGASFHIVERTEDVERHKPAIDAIAIDESGCFLAIERTLIEPFEGQRADDPRFLAALGRLHQAVDLKVPGVLIDVLVPVGAIPTGVDWRRVGERVYAWFNSVRFQFPVGASEHRVPDLDFNLDVHVETLDISGMPGVVAVGRVRPHNSPSFGILDRARCCQPP